MKKRTYSGSAFGDKRLVARFEKVVDSLSSRIRQPIPASQRDWASTKGTYRFWDNSSVTPDEMLWCKFSDSLGQLWAVSGCQRRVLQLCDSTELDYTGHRCAAALGPLHFRKQRGLLLYNSMIVSSLGCPLGLLKQSFHIPSDETFGALASTVCNGRSWQDKQTRHWIEHFEQGQDLVRQREELEVVFVGDRGADIMEVFARRSQERMHFVIRSQHDRKLSDGRNNLVPTIESRSAVGHYEARVMHSQTRRMRSARLQVRFGDVEIKLHKGMADKKQLPAVKVTVVDVRENPAPGIDSAELIHWRLLTTLPVDSFTEARTVIQYYLWRWLIERFHFLLKSGGARVENLQLKTPHRLKNAITTFSIAVMDAFKLRYLAENTPEQNIYDAGISELEHRVLYTYLSKHGRSNVTFDPKNPPTIRQYCIEMGKISGFFPSKRQPIPGLIILIRAREKIDLLIDAFLTFQ